MADIDNVLERLITDSAFREQLGEDPAAALSSYDLSVDDLQLLASSLDGGDDSQRAVEQRTSKSAVVGLLASLTGGGGPQSGATDKYSAPINVTGSTTIRGGLPALDGVSKDSSYLNEGAPADEAQHKLPGRPKAGEITLTRSVSAPADDAQSGLHDRPKAGEISVSRAPAADLDGDGAERWHHEKWNPNRSADNLAPPAGPDESSEIFIKLKNEALQDRLAPGPGGTDCDDEFMSIEDE